MRGKDKWDTDREKSCSRRFALIFTDKNKKRFVSEYYNGFWILRNHVFLTEIWLNFHFQIVAIKIDIR